MRRFWITLVVLALAASSAVAQPAKSAATLAAETDAARTTLGKDEKERAAIATKKATLARRYETELAAVDRLKQQRKSWRRDRQLQDAQAQALDTSKELAALSAKIAGLDTKIAADKRVVIRAIDAELPKLAAGSRKQTLTASRAAAAPPAPVKAHKILMPDGEIDPLADPEELDQQAQALRTTEAELAKKVDELDVQTKRLLKTAELVKAHERAGDLAVRDDDNPRRTGTSGGGRTLGIADDGDPEAGPAPTDQPPPMNPDELGGFQGEETAQVLAEVLDPATGDALRQAGRTSDPKTKAEAAKRARAEVAARLEALRKQRAAVEARAKALRKGR